MTNREELYWLIDQLADAEIEIWFVVRPNSQEPTPVKRVDWIHEAKRCQSQLRARYGYGELPESVRL